MSLSQPRPPGWSPPADYQPLTSALPGITVYAPRPPETKTDEPVTFKCPKCGGSTRYDVASGGSACEHCGYTAPVSSQKVGRQAKEFEFTLETLSQAERGWGVSRREMRCDACGATLALPEGALTASCPFCASNKVNVATASAEQLRPRFLIPFKVLPESNIARVKQWLGRGWFHPSALAAAAAPERYTGIYLPFWTFSARIASDWKAEVGYEHEERYYDSSDKRWRTRTVIRWRWENGHVNLNLEDLLIAGVARINGNILAGVQPFDLRDLTAYAPDFLAGWQAQAYEVNLPEAWEQGKAAMREKAKAACHADISTSHVRNFSMTADFNDEAWRYVLLPVYLAAYRFESKVYQVMINGQTGAIAGQKPVAWWKIWLAIAAMLSPGLCAGLIGLPLLFAGGVGLAPIILGLILLVAGIVFAVKLYQQAVKAEAG